LKLFIISMHSEAQSYFHHALRIDEEVCTGCTHCMQACPTQAIRVHAGKARIDGNRCIDCGECYRVCPVSAVKVEQDNLGQLDRYRYRIALVPSVFFGLFPENIPYGKIISSILELGFTEVFEVERTVPFLAEAQQDYVRNPENEHRPVSAFCPAVVRLIQVKFPSLTGMIMPLKPPVDLAAQWCLHNLDNAGIAREQAGLFYITPCAAKIAAIKSPVGEPGSVIDGVINMNSLYDRVSALLSRKGGDGLSSVAVTPLSPDEMLFALPHGETRHIPGRSLSIDGIRQVSEFLEAMDEEELAAYQFLELRACQNGCAGGILLSRNRWLVAEELLRKSTCFGVKPSGMSSSLQKHLASTCRLGPIEPRPGLILDQDPARAMQKLSRIRRLMCYLPGIDCGACGAPACQTLAEDVVQKKASLSHCPFIQRTMEKSHKLDAEHSYRITGQVWGEQRLEKDCKKKGAENESL